MKTEKNIIDSNSGQGKEENVEKGEPQFSRPKPAKK
jgi:hypothetical protein